MFEKILIANRGDQLPPGSAATQSHRTVAARDVGDLAAETRYV